MELLSPTFAGCDSFIPVTADTIAEDKANMALLSPNFLQLQKKAIEVCSICQHGEWIFFRAADPLAHHLKPVLFCFQYMKS